MKASKKSVLTPELKKRLEEEGYRIAPPPDKMVRKTFVVEEAVLEAFLAAVLQVKSQRKFKIQQAVAEALSAWTKKNGK